MKWGKISQLKNLVIWASGKVPTPAAARGEGLLPVDSNPELISALTKIIVDYEVGSITLEEVNALYLDIKPDLAKIFHSERTLPDVIVLTGPVKEVPEEDPA